MPILRTLVAILLLQLQSQGGAASFSYHDYGPELRDPDPVVYILLRGPIEVGDAERLRTFILDDPERAIRALGLMLESPGGSVSEAMRIGRIVRALVWNARAGSFGSTASSNSYCASACFLVYVAAAKREAFPTSLGIHRIYMRDDQSQRSAADTAIAMRTANRALRDYLDEMDVPQKFYDRMRNSSSLEIDWLSKRDVAELGLFAPFWEEFMISRCNYNKADHLDMYFARNDEEVRALVARMSSFWRCYGRTIPSERRAGLSRLRAMDLR